MSPTDHSFLPKHPLPEGYVISVNKDIAQTEYVREGEEEDRAKRKHASPRTLFRRGHIRRLQSGKRIWVSHTVVNSGKTPLDANTRF